MHYEHNDEKGNNAVERQGQKSCTDLPTMFELLYTIMFLCGFNNVCMDGVIQQ